MKKITLTLIVLLVSGIGFTNTIDPEKNPAERKIVAKIYTWEVETVNGKASGITYNIKDAEKAIKLLNTGDVLKSKIVESHNKY